MAFSKTAECQLKVIYKYIEKEDSLRKYAFLCVFESVAMNLS